MGRRLLERELRLQIAELIAAWATAIFTGTIALAAWVQLPLIARQVTGLSEQIRLSREAERNEIGRAHV